MKGGKFNEMVIVTERKIIDVQQGWLQGSPSCIHVDVCTTCASVVFDPIGHDKWHRTQTASPPASLPIGENHE